MTPSQEEWRPVLGYEGHYEVSDHGNVRSCTRSVTGPTGFTKRVIGQPFKIQTHPSGRPIVALRLSGKQRSYMVHTLVLEAFVGPRPEGHDACHNDGDATNNRLSNLRWDTRAENNRDLLRHGTHSKKRQTHCLRGHLLAMPNLMPTAWERRGHRECRACAAIRREAARGTPANR